MHYKILSTVFSISLMLMFSGCSTKKEVVSFDNDIKKIPQIEKYNQHLFLLGNMNLFVIYHHRLYTFGHFVKIGFPHDDKWEKRYSNYVVGQHKGFTHNNSYKSHCLKVVIIISLQNYIIYINKRSK